MMRIKRISPFFYAMLSLVITSCKKIEVVKKPNVLLICLDDLRPELKSFGATHISSPNIDAFAETGIRFRKHFVNSPSCGPSRYTLLTGQFGPAGNNALFQRADIMNEGTQKVDKSMPAWFKSHGYTTVSVGKVSHHPGGRGGKNWNDSSIVEMPNAWDKHLVPVAEWEHPRGMMHGLANGEVRVKSGEMDVFQTVAGDDNVYPDGAITNEAIRQLNSLAENTNIPFFMAVGIIKPHLPFGAPKTYYDRYNGVVFPEIKYPQKPKGKTTWHGSGEFMRYHRWGKNPNTDPEFADDVRRHYAACVSYADAQVGKILAELKRTGADKNTIVVLWGDHGWHLGEHGIWGKHSLFEESLHAPLLIHHPEMKNKGASTDAIVETVDIFPTLCDLAGIEIPEYGHGVSLKKIVADPNTTGHDAIAYNGKASTIRTPTHRMILHKDGFVELYDHTSTEKETKNVAGQHEELVEELTYKLKTRLD